jgi:2-polyprenyl-3-methyl-5-hydroxy-6-metoxy-1,4-benzoquinol methylase
MTDSVSDGAVLSFFGDFKRLLRRAFGQSEQAPAAAGEKEGTPVLRRSSGMREFWKGIEGEPGLQILDMGAVSQANISFITELGYKVYTADLLETILRFAPNEKADAEPLGQAEAFFRENLNFEEGQFDGILCWDLFDFVPDLLIKPLVARLHHCLKPKGAVLSFFHTGAAGQQVQMFQYRIKATDTLQMTQRGTGKLQRHFNNRTIETLFRDFASLKFYLSRDNLREVISMR